MAEEAGEQHGRPLPTIHLTIKINGCVVAACTIASRQPLPRGRPASDPAAELWAEHASSSFSEC